MMVEPVTVTNNVQQAAKLKQKTRLYPPIVQGCCKNLWI